MGKKKSVGCVDASGVPTYVTYSLGNEPYPQSYPKGVYLETPTTRAEGVGDEYYTVAQARKLATLIFKAVEEIEKAKHE